MQIKNLNLKIKFGILQLLFFSKKIFIYDYAYLYNFTIVSKKLSSL